MRIIVRTVAAATVLTLGALAVPAAHAGGTWRVGIKADATQVLAGHKVVFTGTVNPKAGAAGEKVVLQEKFKPGKPWVDQRKATVGHNGRYSIADRPSTAFVHSYRVVVPASSKHGKGISPTLAVKVYGWSNLDAHQYVNPDFMGYGPVDINGKTYKHSITSDYTDPASIEYNLDHKCTALRSTFGISDDSSTGGQAEVDLESDGTNVYSHTFDLGQSHFKTITLDSPLKIRLMAHNTSTATGVFGYGTFATAQVLCVG